MYLNLSNSTILIEYIYENSLIINSDIAPLYLLDNKYNNEYYILNEDGKESITSNTRTRSTCAIDNRSTSFALLTPNKLGLPYNDVDSKLTDTSNLPISYLSPEGVKYDRVRVHFITGFSFPSNRDGVLLKVSTTDKSSKTINLLSSIFTYEDKWVTYNPKPFLYAGRQYSTYIEYKVPSLQYLKDSYKLEYQVNSNSDILSCKITNNLGFYDSASISISAGFYTKIEEKDTQFYTKGIEIESTSIESSDKFNDVGVKIQESSNGDYLEFYGLYNNTIFGDYINALNSSGYNYIALHELEIEEQLPGSNLDYNLIGYYSPINNTPNLTSTFLSNFNEGDYWVSADNAFSSTLNLNLNKGDIIVLDTASVHPLGIRVLNELELDEISDFISTSKMTYVQDNSFSTPNLFRPVLKFGGAALSYRINYTLKLLNTIDNSIISKSGSMVSFNTGKWGKELSKINVDLINNYSVYNKKITTTINSKLEQNNINTAKNYSKNVISFLDSKSVNVTTSIVSIDSTGSISNTNSTKQLLPQNMALISLMPFDSTYLFTIYDIKDGSAIFMDMVKFNDITLVLSGTSNIRIKPIQNDTIKGSNGQVAFTIPASSYNLLNEDGEFWITSGSTQESVMYTGRYTKRKEDKILDTFNSIKLELDSKIDEIAELNKIIEQQKEEVKDISVEVEKQITIRVRDLVEKKLKEKKPLTENEVDSLARSIKNTSFNKYQ